MATLQSQPGRTYGLLALAQPVLAHAKATLQRQLRLPRRGGLPQGRVRARCGAAGTHTCTGLWLYVHVYPLQMCARVRVWGDHVGQCVCAHGRMEVKC